VTTVDLSARGRANRRKGHTAERDLARWLRENGFPHAERAVRTGFRTADRVTADPGDIAGIPGVVWSVKDCATERIGPWLAELDAMDGGDYRLLVVKRRGCADPGRWWVYIEANALPGLRWGCGSAALSFPVRAELAPVVALLAQAGYGTPAGG
jgi:hypothetical protein